MFVNNCRTGRNYFLEVISIVCNLMWVDFLKTEYLFKKCLGIAQGLKRKRVLLLLFRYMTNRVNCYNGKFVFQALLPLLQHIIL